MRGHSFAAFYHAQVQAGSCALRLTPDSTGGGTFYFIVASQGPSPPSPPLPPLAPPSLPLPPLVPPSPPALPPCTDQGGCSAHDYCTMTGVQCPLEHQDADMGAAYAAIDDDDKWHYKGTLKDGRPWFESDSAGDQLRYLYYSSRAGGYFLSATAPLPGADDPWEGDNSQVRLTSGSAQFPEGTWSEARLYCGHDTGPAAAGCSRHERGGDPIQMFYWCNNNGPVNVSCTCSAEDMLSSCEHPPSPPDTPPSPPGLPLPAPPAPPVCTPPPNGVLTPLRETAPATVRLTVWLPQTLTVVLDDPILQPIAGLLHEPACVAQRWQTSAVRAVASIGGEGLPTVHGLDVTKLVSFIVLNGSVATVVGSKVSALTPGLTAVVAEPFQSAGALLRVDPEPVTVTGIISFLVNEAAWAEGAPPWVPPSAGFGTAAWMRAQLVAEYDVANLYLWASLSDGARMPLAHDDAQGVLLRPLRPHSLVSARVSRVTCTAGSSPWEIGWSLKCDGAVIAWHGGSSFSQVVSFPRTNATGNSSSICTLTLTDDGGDGWDGAYR